MAKKADNTALYVLGAIILGGGAYGIYYATHKDSSSAPNAATAPSEDKAVLPPGTSNVDSGYVDPTTGKNMDAMVYAAVTLARIGHAKEGAYWANIVAAHQPTASQLQQVRAAGYAV